MKQNVLPSNQKGFTIVEIAVVVPLMMLIILALFSLLTYLLQSSASEQTAAQNLYDEHVALAAIEADISLSASFLPTIDSSQTDPAKNGTWGYSGDSPTSRVLILRSYATTLNPQSNDRRAIFLSDKGCTTDQLYFNTPLTYNTIYFVQNGTLFRRRIINKMPATCNPPYQKQTCPTQSLAPAAWKCEADDEIIAMNVTNFSVDYYANSDDDTPSSTYGNANGGTEVTSADSSNITIGITRRAYGAAQTNSLSLRASKLITGQTDN